MIVTSNNNSEPKLGSNLFSLSCCPQQCFYITPMINLFLTSSSTYGPLFGPFSFNLGPFPFLFVLISPPSTLLPLIFGPSTLLSVLLGFPSTYTPLILEPLSLYPLL